METVKNNVVDTVLVDDLLLEESDEKYVSSVAWLTRKKFKYDNYSSSGDGYKCHKIWKRYFAINGYSFQVSVDITAKIISDIPTYNPLYVQTDSVFVTGNMGYRDGWNCTNVKTSMKKDYNCLRHFKLNGKRLRCDGVEEGVRQMLVKLIGISEIAKKYK